MEEAMDRTLREGMTGTDVRTAQAFLNYHIGPQSLLPIKEDGVFGGATRARTMEFQRRANLTVDGIIGFDASLPAVIPEG